MGNRWFGIAALAVIACVRTASAQESDDDRRARLHFEAGRSHYEEGAYDRALDEFSRAWELSHRPPLLINLATVHERLANYCAAAENLREFVRMQPESENRAVLERRIENLGRLAQERQGGCDGASPRNATTMTTVTATASSGSGGGDDGLMIGAIAGFAAGGAGAIAMGIFGGLALAEDSSLRDGCGATASCTEAQVSDANTFAAVADVSMGVAIAGVAAGTVLLVLALTSSGERPSQAALVPVVGPDFGGAAAHVRF